MARSAQLESLEGVPGYAEKKSLFLCLRRSYPALHIAALLGPQDKKAEAFQQERPDLSFARVVLREGRVAVWFFRDEADRDVYRRWCMPPEDNFWERMDLEAPMPSRPEAPRSPLS